MSDDFNTTNLLILLKGMITEIEAGNISEGHQEQIWNRLTFDKNEPNTREIIKYLFMGWYLHSHLGEPKREVFD